MARRAEPDQAQEFVVRAQQQRTDRAGDMLRNEVNGLVLRVPSLCVAARRGAAGDTPAGLWAAPCAVSAEERRGGKGGGSRWTLRWAAVTLKQKEHEDNK